MKPTPNLFRRFVRHSILPLFAAVMVAFTAGPAKATSYWWDNNGTTAGFGTAGGTWGTSQNWSTDITGLTLPGVTTSNNTDDLNFGSYNTGLAAGTVALSGSLDANSLTFAANSGAIVLSGASSTLTLGGTGIVTVNNASDTIGSNTSAVLAGTGGLTKLGTGTLTLNGSAVNTLSGGLTLNSGTLALDFANLTPATDLIKNTNTLALGGGILSIKGRAPAALARAWAMSPPMQGAGRFSSTPTAAPAPT